MYILSAIQVADEYHIGIPFICIVVVLLEIPFNSSKAVGGPQLFTAGVYIVVFTVQVNSVFLLFNARLCLHSIKDKVSWFRFIFFNLLNVKKDDIALLHKIVYLLCEYIAAHWYIVNSC